MTRSFNYVKLAATVGLFTTLALFFGHGMALERSGTPEPGGRQDCTFTVEVAGNGRVQVDQAGHPARQVESAQLETSCSDLVTLTARPSGPWLFDGWLGLDEGDDSRATITVAAPAELTAVFRPRKVNYIPADEPYYDRAGNLVDTIPVYEPVWKPLSASEAEQTETAAPTIDLWYGTPQPYGIPGVAQQWYDILGTVSDTEMDLASLEYTLNDEEPVAMGVGGDGSVADGRRLWNLGDFVIDLSIDDLNVGSNTVVITAKDDENNTTTKNVTVNYNPAPGGWPLPSNVVWDSAGIEASGLLEQSQIVDGKWQIVSDGVRTSETGYDRVLDVAGIAFTSFEALVPFTVHSYDDSIIGDPVQARPAIGLLVHWTGHTDDPVVCTQPKCGFYPVGMANWYEWDGNDDGQLSMWVRYPSREDFGGALDIQPGPTTYLWKVQVDNSQGSFGKYRIKIWPQGQAEPNDWLMEKNGTAASQQAGSLLLLAHHVDITYGDVKLRELNGDFTDPVISNLNVEVGETEATVSWTTDKQATSEVIYFVDPATKMSVSDDTPKTNHSLLINNLSPGTSYTFFVQSQDDSLNTATSDEESFQTESADLLTLQILPPVGGEVGILEGAKPGGYMAGDVVKLGALPSAGYFFDEWEISVAGNGTPVESAENPLSLEITNNTTVEALFKELYTFEILPSASGVAEFVVGEKSGYQNGDVVVLKAVPDARRILAYWRVMIEGQQDELNPTDNPLQLTITNNTKVKAVFEKHEEKWFLPLSLAR